MDLPVTFYDAVLGGRSRPDARRPGQRDACPKGSNTGTRLRLKGRGLSDPRATAATFSPGWSSPCRMRPTRHLDAFAEGVPRQAPLQRQAGADGPPVRRPGLNNVTQYRCSARVSKSARSLAVPPP